MGCFVTDRSIILTGMPGAGKSTVGPLLAGKLGMSFIDTDDAVKRFDGRELRRIVEEDGYEVFLDIQNKAIMSLELDNSVIATGGSVVKSDDLMCYLKRFGKIVYLRYDIDILERRLSSERKLARVEGQSFKQLFEEREPLYRKYAAIIIDCTGKTPEEIVKEIC